MATQSASLQYAEPYREEPEDGRPVPPKQMLPTMYDLPDEEVDQPGMPDVFHIWQPRLLDETFRPPNYTPEEIFTATDMNLYYDVHDFSRYKRPDWFAVVGLRSPEMRLSYVIWQEEVRPLIAVELLSPRTKREDLGELLRDVQGKPTKWEMYESFLQVPYYVTFDRRTDNLRIFKHQGEEYEEVTDHQGRLWMEEIELGLGLWRGSYLDKTRTWLRWYDRDGKWLLNKDELLEQEQQRVNQERLRAEQERLRAEQERLRAEQERLRAEQERREKEASMQKAALLAAKLRDLGIDPDQL